MLEELLQDTNNMLALLNTAFQEADADQQQGIADFLAERIDAMGKHRWMLRSFLKEARA
jgi:DNA-binding ferritin-like protein